VRGGVNTIEKREKYADASQLGCPQGDRQAFTRFSHSKLSGCGRLSRIPAFHLPPSHCIAISLRVFFTTATIPNPSGGEMVLSKIPSNVREHVTQAVITKYYHAAALYHSPRGFDQDGSR